MKRRHRLGDLAGMTSPVRRHKKHSGTNPAAANTNAGDPTSTTTDDRRRQQRLERDCAQVLRAQQKLTGRKTTEEYARVRIVHRQDDATRKRHLHQNGKKATVTEDSQRLRAARLFLGLSANTDNLTNTVDVQERRPQTARDPSQDDRPSSVPTRARPQSAKLSRRSDPPNASVAGHRVSVALLERCQYNPVPLTTSRSAPRLHAALEYAKAGGHSAVSSHQDTPKTDIVMRPLPVVHTFEADATPGRRRIVVNVPHLEIREDLDDDDSPSGQASSAPLVLGQRHERRDGTRRSAWGETD